jgi:cytochrome c biogenesis protein CcdA
MEQVSLLVAFGAGLLSFLSPCVLPLVPVYLGTVCGPEILEPGAQKKRLPVFFHSLSFVIGFSLVFIILGASVSLAWTPCIGPVLGGILTLAWSSETAWQGAYLLAIYSLGLGLPFLIIGAAFDSIRPLLRRIHRYSTWSYIISGLLLIAIGILILTGNLSWLQGGI